MIPERYKKYEKLVTVSCVNFQTVWGDKAANLDKIKSHIEAAVAVGSNMIIFPEMALSGYECSDECASNGKPCSMHQESAETVPGPSTEAIAKLTSKYSVYVVLGMPERDKNNPGICFNSAALVGPEGVIGAYRKLHLGSVPPVTESICFTPGDELPVFETRYGPIGILVCYDFWRHPELSRILTLKGARIIINSTAVAFGVGRDEFMRVVAAANATVNHVFVASADLVGKDRNKYFMGLSTIVGPIYPRLAPVLAEAADREQVISATLNFESLHRLDEFSHWKQERRSEVISHEFAKLLGKKQIVKTSRGNTN